MTIQWGKIVTSKTLWMNIILLALGIIDVLTANAAGGEPLIDPKYLVLAAGILNLIMRFITNDGLIEKK